MSVKIKNGSLKEQESSNPDWQTPRFESSAGTIKPKPKNYV